MPVIRKLIAPDDTQDSQWLKIDHSSRYIENHIPEWQFLFGPNSALSNSAQVVKIAAQLDKDTLNDIKIAAYLYDQKNNSISNASTCTFRVFRVLPPDWTESLITTLSTVQLSNSYFYNISPLSAFAPADLDGGDTLMIEASMVRLGVTYRDRVYFNHLGVYDSIFRLRQDVDFLDITKLDE